MVDVRQLELDLDLAFEEASAVPEEADVRILWQQFEGVMRDLPWRDQLRLGGEVINQLAGICEAKADVLWEDWQDAHNADGPVMDGDWLRGLTRQTQELDFSEHVKRPSYALKEQDSQLEDEDSVVGEVDKATVLAFLDDLTEEEEKQKALAVSHAENVSDWIQQLSSRGIGRPQKLIELQQQLQMPLIELWIAALLGGFSLEQRGEFYETAEVWVGQSGIQ
ncbi:MAG: hypothetical protein AAFU71_06360 [Cyanobacteria bacterium J06632_22]